MIPRLDLDFQSTRRGNPVVAGALLAVGLASAGAVILMLVNLNRTAADLETRIEVLSSVPVARRPVAADAGEERQAQGRVRGRRLVAERLAIPWQQLMDDLESAGDPEIAVLALQPLPAQHQLRLSGEAKDRRALTRYLARLEATPSLEGVYLASHEVGKEDPDRSTGPRHKPGLRFSVTARWPFEPY